MMMKNRYNFFVSLRIMVVLALLSDNILRTCQAKRTVTVSTRVIGVLDNEYATSYCATADTLSAGENFDNFTWWSLQLQFPVNLEDHGGVSFTSIVASTKENGLVQVVDDEELVILNWTIADTPRSFVLQWICNDGIVWNSHDFCQDRQGRHERGDSGGGSSSTDSCLDRFTGGYAARK
jgi:hypothetical protein